MCSAYAPKVVTANDLISGDVIYLSPSSQWVRQLKDAELVLDAAGANKRLDFAQAQQAQAVGAYLADANAGTDGPTPVHFREAFRARGPSNLFHGKQAEQIDVSIR